MQIYISDDDARNTRVQKTEDASQAGQYRGSREDAEHAARTRTPSHARLTEQAFQAACPLTGYATYSSFADLSRFCPRRKRCSDPEPTSGFDIRHGRAFAQAAAGLRCPPACTVQYGDLRRSNCPGKSEV